MPNPFSKQYQGLYHFAVVALALLAGVLTSPSLVNLGLPWVGQAAQAVAFLGLLLQRFTPVGDTKP